MPVTTLRRFLALGLAAALLASPAIGAEKPNKETRRLQQQLRQAEQEKVSLSQQVAESENKIKDAQSKTADAERKAGAEAGRNARLSKELESLKAEKATLAETTSAEIGTLKAKLAETQRKLAELSQDKQQLDAAFTEQKAGLAACLEHNASMYQLGNELLAKYQQKGCGTALLQGEPFTGLKRAQIEKMVEEDRETLDKNQIVPRGSDVGAR